jgi:hypothetical protein
MSEPPRSIVEAGRRASARILSSSRALGVDELLDVGVVDVEDHHLGRAAGRAPDLIVPALASAPRMKLTGPLAVPPEGEQLLGGADPGEG